MDPDVPHDGDSRYQHLGVAEDHEIEAKGGNGIGGQEVGRVRHGTAQLGSDGPTEEGGGGGGDQVDTGGLRLRKPPDEGGRQDEERGDQRCPREP